MKKLDTADIFQNIGLLFVVLGAIFVAMGISPIIVYTTFGVTVVLSIISTIVRKKRKGLINLGHFKLH